MERLYRYSGLVIKMIVGPSVWRLIERIVLAGAGAAVATALSGCVRTDWELKNTGSIATPTPTEIVELLDSQK